MSSMNTCEVCNIKISDENICPVCYYPLKGTKEEQVKYRAKQVMQKSDVKESFTKLNKARIILFAIGGLYFLLSIYLLSKSAPYIVVYPGLGISVFFLGFGFLSYKFPIVSLAISFGVIVFYYLILFMISPALLWSGLLWRAIIFFGLGYGLLSVVKAAKILKKNPYLASQMGLDKIKNVDQDILDS